MSIATGLILGAGGLILLTGAAGLLAGKISFNMAFAKGKPLNVGDLHYSEQEAAEIRQGIEYLDSLEYEEVRVTSYDGLKLYARYYPVENPKGSVVMMHGYRSSRNDFCGGAGFYRSLGFNLLIPDQRSHGNSEGEHITFGIKERHDCVTWVNYLNSRHDAKADVFLAGISMGASTVLMATELDLPDNVRGVIADCGFTSPYDIIRRVAEKDMHAPAKIILPFTDFFARHTAGFSIREASAPEALAKSSLPVAFIHGKNDDFVPPEMSRQNYDACKGEKVIYFAEGAGHGTSFLAQRRDVEKVLADFVRAHSTEWHKNG